jgi:thiosulfate/3-mercaptopyruvate sulfurtransferase
LSLPGRQILISPQQLYAEIGADDLLVVDCRFNLLKPEAGRKNWAAGHIAGACYADLDKDLAAMISPQSGRHPLPDAESFASLLGSWGVTPGTRVVAYDDAGGAIAARLWWLLGWVGHAQALLLDGGLPAWLACGYPLEESAPMLQQGRYPVRPGNMPVISAAEVQAGLAQAELTLIDARDGRRFAGLVEPIDSRAGHVPGAVNRPFQQNLDDSGRFLSADKLQDDFASLLGHDRQKNTASMCGSGVTACHHIFAMQLAGLEAMPSLYVGSWSEWIRDVHRPCEPAEQSE